MASLPIDVQCSHTAPDRGESARRRALVLGITTAVMGAEAVGGWLAHSLALVAERAPMLAAGAPVGLGLFVARVAHRPATPERSYGLQRLEILAALVNGAMLIAIAVGIGIEPWHRFHTPPAVRASLLIGVATAGLAANLASVRILHHGHDHSLNQRGAYLHVVSDALGALGAIAAGVIILATGWTLADPLISVGIGALILHGAWRLVKESVDVLLEATPTHISLPTVHDRLVSVPGVESVHDLHVWTVTSGVVALSGPLAVKNPSDNQPVLEAVQGRRRGEFGMRHVTGPVE